MGFALITRLAFVALFSFAAVALNNVRSLTVLDTMCDKGWGFGERHFWLGKNVTQYRYSEI